MNTTASFSSDRSWSRRCSTETVFSIQGQETDFVRDTSDTDACASDAERDVEYEPATDSDDTRPALSDDSSVSENEIIATKVIEVSVNDDGELQFADSEQTESGGSDSEMDLHDYWRCARCRARNNNPLYRYCEACFKVRKNFFPPRPKRKKRRDTKISDVPRTLSQDSGVESQELSQGPNSEPMSLSRVCFNQSSAENMSVTETVISKSVNVMNRSETVTSQDLKSEPETDQPQTLHSTANQSENVPHLAETSRDNSVQISQENNSVDRLVAKRRAESVDRNNKRTKIVYSESNSDSDSNKSDDVKPLAKTISDPSITIEETVNITKKVISNTLKEKVSGDLCIICCSEPKSGVFVHGRVAHICCCYKCAVKVWQKAKRCPVCNSKVSNVLKAVVM